MKYINTPETAIKSLTISQAKVAMPAILSHLFDNYEVIEQRLIKIENSHYDVYIIKACHQEYEFYDNVTAFFGKGKIIQNLMEKDLPSPNTPYSLEFVLQNYYQYLKKIGIGKNINIDNVKVRFKIYASNMVSNYIAAYYPDRNEIDVTAIKEYNKTYDFPILHSFNLYKLFVLHQVIHILDNHEFTDTETEIKGNYYQPIIGKDCIHFTPINKRTHANEFINYMFWTHQPNAFDDENEINAFICAVSFGIETKVFTQDEIIESIKEAKINNKTQENLINEINHFYKKAMENEVATSNPNCFKLTENEKMIANNLFEIIIKNEFLELFCENGNIDNVTIRDKKNNFDYVLNFIAFDIVREGLIRMDRMENTKNARMFFKNIRFRNKEMECFKNQLFKDIKDGHFIDKNQSDVEEYTSTTIQRVTDAAKKFDFMKMNGFM